jgi:DNA-binding transcriptional LysR family regulator
MRAGRLADSSLIARKVGVSQLVLFASPAYLERAGAPKSLAELAQHEHLLYRSQGGRAILRMTGPKGEEAIEVRGRISADDMAFLQLACLAGAGIAALPIELAYKAALAGTLVRVLPRYNIPSGAVYIVLPSSALVPARVALLRDHLVKHFEAELREAHKDCVGKKPGPRRFSGTDRPARGSAG